jgi:hypothetical protein
MPRNSARHCLAERKRDMTLPELLYYHASEGGLLCANSAFDLARDAGFDTSEIDFAQWADTANGRAIADTLRGDILGARLFKTAHLTLAEMPCGTITDGNIDWPNEAAFSAAMRDHGIRYSVTRVC